MTRPVAHVVSSIVSTAVGWAASLVQHVYGRTHLVDGNTSIPLHNNNGPPASHDKPLSPTEQKEQLTLLGLPFDVCSDINFAAVLNGMSTRLSIPTLYYRELHMRMWKTKDLMW